MNFSEYQKATMRTARPHDAKDELMHLVLGLVGEAGEIAEKFKKWVRDQESDESKIDRDDMKKELGDVLWYVSVMAEYLGLELDDVASFNIAKLADRQKRGVIKGVGDNR